LFSFLIHSFIAEEEGLSPKINLKAISSIHVGFNIFISFHSAIILPLHTSLGTSLPSKGGSK